MRDAPLLTRPAAVAGTFYPGSATELADRIDTDLHAAVALLTSSEPASPNAPTTALTPAPGAAPPKALIVPHAGYIFSGPVAASAYARLLPWRSAIRHVVLLGPAHRVAVASMALSSATAWATPLGTVSLDTAARDRLVSMPGVVIDDRAHGPEHALEVHVPFLQRILEPGFTLLPIIVGPAAPERVADVLDAVWGGPETLVVVSSDLSHYHGYAVARDLDEATAASIVARRGDEIDPSGACGAYPVRGLLVAAARHDLRVALVDLRNSGDTAGSRDRVVGYGSFVLTAGARP